MKMGIVETRGRQGAMTALRAGRRYDRQASSCTRATVRAPGSGDGRCAGVAHEGPCCPDSIRRMISPAAPLFVVPCTIVRVPIPSASRRCRADGCPSAAIMST